MRHLSSKLLIIICICLCEAQLQNVNYSEDYYNNEVSADMEQLQDDLDLTHVNWKVMMPLLLQRQQLRLCLAIYRHDRHLVLNTPCETLLGNGLMAYCDIGHVKDLSMTMRDAFGGMLFDTFQQCRPGMEIFGIRCRRRA